MSASIIPESAPFNAEQRAWLNGFLAGWVGLDGASEAAGVANGVALLEANGETAEAETEEDFPWHDDSLALDERLALAEEKPLNRRLMAAMAQLDCGACGYVCKTYSEAIAAGDEKSLTLCSPGGKETTKALKKLLKEAPAADTKPSANGAAKAHESGYSRSNPYAASVVSCENLNAEGSAKQTTHAVIDLGDSGLTYAVGDSLGVYPTNCPELVGELLAHLEAVDNDALREALTTKHCLREVTDELLDLLAVKATVPDEADAARALVDSDDLDEMDVLDALRRAPSAKLGVEEFVACLSEINPRLYSIASSLKAHPGQVHLTVGKATTQIGERLHKGVASTMFADRLAEGDAVGVFVQPSHGFTVPADPAAPMVMVGPGTGIAPFRAFLEERSATGAGGKNWLFFGDQHEASDFLYRKQLESLKNDGMLTRLSTAFSRDQAEKVYVQNRMLEEGAELFAWLEEGGYFFVCGDAKRMANDVDKALHALIAEHGGMSDADAKAYVSKLKETGRYARDVY